MSITVNGQSCVPPGFRFHPTEEELLNYYLRKKVASEKIDLDVIRDVDLNKLEPWDIQEKCRIGSTPQNDWYFFSHKDKKYPTGTRTNRATAAGFWKATGRDKVIYTSFKRIGMRKTLVFYKGRAPHGQKSDWIMHEYRLDDISDTISGQSSSCSPIGEAAGQEDGWVVCRVFKKKNHHKALDGGSSGGSSITSDAKTYSDEALDQILQYMGRSCKQETEASITNMSISDINANFSMRYVQPIDTIFGSSQHDQRFLKLPALENPALPIPSLPLEQPTVLHHGGSGSSTSTAYLIDDLSLEPSYQAEQGINDWASLDRLVALHLNGQSEMSKQLACFDDPCFTFCPTSKLNTSTSQDPQDHNRHHPVSNNEDLWSFTQSASAPSVSDHVSNVSHNWP